jgi:dTDP-4-dehydrorhamnose 3,5-epimerase
MVLKGMEIKETYLSGLYLITPQVLGDERGFFMEVFKQDVYEQAGLTLPTFVQQNHSKSGAKVVRGLHFQYDKPLGKLIRVVNGSAFMVALDIRKNSSSVGDWFGTEISADNKRLLYAPPGFASGFAVTGNTAEVEYLYTALYNKEGESNIFWLDKRLGIDWPYVDAIVSERDQKAKTLNEWLSSPQSDLL